MHQLIKVSLLCSLLDVLFLEECRDFVREPLLHLFANLTLVSLLELIAHEGHA